MKTTAIHLAALLACTALAPANEWTASEADGKVEARFGGELQAAWQRDLTVDPPGGDRFRNSAFLHPLTTPSGFVWTDAQPADHVHHSGLWWPWKFVEVDGKRHVTWEIQQGQGAHIAREVKVVHAGSDHFEWELHNETVIRKPGRNAGPPVLDGIPVIREVARVRLSRHGEHANLVDVRLEHQPIGDHPVFIPRNHYSGFTWRGPQAWKAEATTTITSEGHDLSNANGEIARWLLMTGPTPAGGQASVLMMSAAADIAGTPERLRVWNAGMHGGVPFINFNPVASEKLPLNSDTPATVTRQYRVIASDAVLTAEQAEQLWKSWRGK